MDAGFVTGPPEMVTEWIDACINATRAGMAKGVQLTSLLCLKTQGGAQIRTQLLKCAR